MSRSRLFRSFTETDAVKQRSLRAAVSARLAGLVDRSRAGTLTDRDRALLVRMGPNTRAVLGLPTVEPDAPARVPAQ